MICRRFVTPCLLVLASFFLVSAGHQKNSEDEAWAREAGERLLSVLGTGDRGQFERYLDQETDLPEEIKSDAAFSMIYDGDSMRNQMGGGRSVVEIMEDGDIEMILGRALDDSFIISFVPRQYIDEIDEQDFFSVGWMRKFFSCWFSEQNGRWQLHYNLCFAETGGPYRGAY